MHAAVAVVQDIVTALAPGDDLEAEHRSRILEWLGSTDDVFRRVKPAEPDQHLVSYVVPVDADGNVLLVDHINARLWLPPGGHVEPGEHPHDTAVREVAEELGLTAVPDPAPLFLTVTRTVGLDRGHTDVSLWYVLHCDRTERLTPDLGEFHRVRWWSPEDIEPARCDPHFPRFLHKMRR
ncbi:8-oxo-dGTP pyrophosphatase MutT (NUDIX family) [Actinoplanes tereljensis]|uniref:DNA mismatch repair protein MutT n=1 Tax=Paractinoplanes tereljensis TaxID=571912 RepID=A0A919NVU3_9ACTN|nr:NUDIX hydrolase [Actinoplanes tereljensis]GIF26229.1 DNA mismatch repair protein MutT [Actinoplanes tereljensis]